MIKVEVLLDLWGKFGAFVTLVHVHLKFGL